jgi:hypothetical protein
MCWLCLYYDLSRILVMQHEHTFAEYVPALHSVEFSSFPFSQRVTDMNKGVNMHVHDTNGLINS